MNVPEGMDCTLHALTCEQVAGQLERCLEMLADQEKGGPFSTDLVVIRGDEEIHKVFAVDAEDGEAVIRTAPAAILAIGELTSGGESKPLGVAELAAALRRTGCREARVNQQSAVGKILAAGAKGEYKVAMFPVPRNIEDVNTWVHKRCARKCLVANLGTECGRCPKLSECEIIREADDAARRHFEGPKKTKKAKKGRNPNEGKRK